jgi:hypothetical protein
VSSDDDDDDDGYDGDDNDDDDNNNKVKSSIFPVLKHHTTKTHRGHGGKAPLTPGFGTKRT